MDRFTKISTASIAILFVGILSLVYISNAANDISPLYFPAGLFTTIFLICFIFRPLSYEIFKNEIIINRLISNVHFDFSEIKEVKSIENLSAFSAVRVFAVGGLFGYFGIFWNYANGRMTYYASKNEGAIMIVTNENKKIVITPDNVDVFLECFLKSNKNKSNQ